MTVVLKNNGEGGEREKKPKNRKKKQINEMTIYSSLKIFAYDGEWLVFHNQFVCIYIEILIKKQISFIIYL